MVQNKQSFSTFRASRSSSFSSSAPSSMVPPTTSPSHLPSSTFQSIFGAPASTQQLHPSSSALPMGQVFSRPQLTSLSPSPAPSSLALSNTGSRFKRAFVGRRKKSDTHAPPSPRLDKGKDPQTDDSLHSLPGTAPRPLGAKQLTLQLAQHVFNKKSAPASPAMSGITLPPPSPPPSPPPKHQPTSPSSRVTPINTSIDKRISIMTTSSPIAPALDYMKKSDEPMEQVTSKENERKDSDKPESKDIRRQSDSTLSLHTIRPSKTPRPVSLAESLHSTHTIVPMNKRLSALITDAEYVMAEEEEGSANDEKGRAFGRPSPTSSLRLRDRRSQSLSLGPPLSMMLSSPTVSNATMSLEAITVTLPRSASEGCEPERLAAKEVVAVASCSLPSEATRDAATRHTRAVSSLNQVSRSATSRLERTLPDIPDPQSTISPQQTHSPQPSFRQTAISMTSGFAPAAGLARRAVERMGRVWGSKSSISGPLLSPLGEPSSNGRTGPPSRAGSSHSESVHHSHGRRIRHNAQTPSVSSVSSSISDHEGPQLGRCLRGPVRAPGVGGLVFGRELKTCVGETAIDSILGVLHASDAGREERGPDIAQWSRPSAPLEGRHVPALVVRCAQHILEWGIQEQGLFRVSGRSSHVAKLRAEFDTGADFDIVESNPGDLDPHAVASVFKAFLRELPEPILTNQLMPYFDAAIASERLSNNIQDPIPLHNIHELRKPPSLSTIGMPKFVGSHPPSESLRKTLSTLVSRLPQENRDLLFTVTEVINHTAKRSSETKMPLSNLLLVLCPSLSMNPPLLQALCESQGIWNGVHPRKGSLQLDEIVGEANQSFLEVDADVGDAGTNQLASHPRSSSESERFVRPLPSLPTADGSTSISPCSSTCEPLEQPNSVHDGISQVPFDVSPSFSTTDDSSSISHLSQSGRPVTPTSLNFKLTNPYLPPSLSCSTDSLSLPSLSSGSPMEMVKPLSLVDECGEQQSSNSPHSPDIAEPIPLPIPSLRSTQTPLEAQFQFPGPRDSVVRHPAIHCKSSPSISTSSSSSADARSASVSSRARRLKRPSLHLLFTKHSSSSVSSPALQTPVVSSPLTSLQGGALRPSSTPESSPDSMVTAPQSSRFSYPPILNTAIDESSISLALGIKDDAEARDSQGPTRSTPHHSPPEESGMDTQFHHLDVALPEEVQFGEYNWTQSVLMAAGEPSW